MYVIYVFQNLLVVYYKKKKKSVQLKFGSSINFNCRKCVPRKNNLNYFLQTPYNNYFLDVLLDVMVVYNRNIDGSPNLVGASTVAEQFCPQS